MSNTTANTEAAPTLTQVQDILLPQITHLYALRYATLAAFCVLVYDTFLVFPEELHLVWPEILLFFRHPIAWRRHSRTLKRKRQMPMDQNMLAAKLVYVLMRYSMVVAALLLFLIFAHPVQETDDWCKKASLAAGILDALVEVAASGVIVHRLLKLWEFNRLGTLAMIVSFAVFRGSSLSFGTAATHETADSVTFIAETLNQSGIRGNIITACNVNKLPRHLYIATWSLAASYDVFVFVLFVINALIRPRAESQYLMDIIYRDGILFFVATFSMRLMNVITTTIGKDAGIFYIGVALSGCLVTVAATRSFLRLFYFTKLHNSNSAGNLQACPCGHMFVNRLGDEQWCEDCLYGETEATTTRSELLPLEPRVKR